MIATESSFRVVKLFALSLPHCVAMCCFVILVFRFAQHDVMNQRMTRHVIKISPYQGHITLNVLSSRRDLSNQPSVAVIHISLAYFLWDVCKQNSPRCDAAKY